ncbi:hypothetical protein HYDPIDRAFT_34547 [Hydnomerulius pinastri MD-312]|uniref:Uncharacterized protein n=1 Tax=Hydnomerulius pinastri MD-312 TaxID=994086 RepID=A0A0C9W5V9_9AGAM|nr:hypothetical protein HYDPIDRAFT_34547 [Hydnomerulius pinastri MD-312]
MTSLACALADRRFAIANADDAFTCTCNWICDTIAAPQSALDDSYRLELQVHLEWVCQANLTAPPLEDANQGTVPQMSPLLGLTLGAHFLAQEESVDGPLGGSHTGGVPPEPADVEMNNSSSVVTTQVPVGESAIIDGPPVSTQVPSSTAPVLEDEFTFLEGFNIL